MPEKEDALERRWKKYQELTGYTDKELAVFRSFPQNVKAIESSPLMANHEVVIEVIESSNCIAEYKVGDTFRIDGFGFLKQDQCPPTPSSRESDLCLQHDRWFFPQPG